MKILQVCPYDFSRPGGVKTHILGLSTSLRDRGHDVKIVVPKQSGNDHLGLNVYEFGKNVGLAFGGTKIDVNLCFGKEWKRLKQFIKSENFDVTHYHTIWNPYLGIQVRMIFRGHQVATFHDTPSDTLIGNFLKRWVMPIISKVTFNWLDTLISVSETQRNCIKRFSNREIKVIPNGIPQLVNSNPIREFVDGKFNILFLGRLEPRKGVLDAIKSFEMFSREVRESRLIIAGDGRERSQAEAYCMKNGIENVRFLGLVSDQRKFDLFATSDLYIASALYGESFGIVLLEAMQANVPLVGYSNDGYRELLTDEQIEYFVNPGDIVGLAESIHSIYNLSTKDKLKAIGKKYASSFEWSQLVDDVESLYKPNVQIQK